MRQAKTTRTAANLGDTIRRLSAEVGQQGSTGYVSDDGRTSVAIATNQQRSSGRSLVVAQASTPRRERETATD